MVYADGTFHPVGQTEVRRVKKRRLSKAQKIAKSYPAPSVNHTFEYCCQCNAFRHLRFRKVLFGGIEVSTRCCNQVLGYLDFPPQMRKRLDRKVYIAWLNG